MGQLNKLGPSAARPGRGSTTRSPMPGRRSAWAGPSVYEAAEQGLIPVERVSDKLLLVPRKFWVRQVKRLQPETK